MALAHAKKDSFYSNPYGEMLSLDKFALAERRLKDKKQLLEDVQHEYDLLEADTFKTYKKEVIYLLSLNPTLINKAKKWLEIVNDTKNKIDKRKKYEEKDIYEMFLKDLQKLLGYDIEITHIMQYGYEGYAYGVYFNCMNHKFELKIPNMDLVDIKHYRDYGDYVFKLTLYNCDKPNVAESFGATYFESELKDIFEKWLIDNNIIGVVSLPQEVE